MMSTDFEVSLLGFQQHFWYVLIGWYIRKIKYNNARKPLSRVSCLHPSNRIQTYTHGGVLIPSHAHLRIRLLTPYQLPQVSFKVILSCLGNNILPVIGW